MINQIDLNLLRILESLSKTESVKATASEFSVSSSAISQSIARLEEQLGLQLLLREHKKIRVSVAGHNLISATSDAISKISVYLSALKSDLESDEPSGLISLGCPSEFGTSFVIEWFSQLQTKYPKIKIKLRLGSPRTLLSYLLSGEVDFIIADDGPYYEGLGQNFSIENIFEEELILCVSSKLYDEYRPKKDFHSISRLPHLDYSSDGSAIGIWYQFYFKKVPSKLELSLVSENVRALISGVKNHLGMAMIPRYLIEKELDKGTIVEIAPEKKKLLNALILIQHQDKVPTKAEKIFMQMLKSQTKVIGR
ncbi:MAG: substrate-binding domain-containing protein [Bacteriovoracaceae bacterium]